MDIFDAQIKALNQMLELAHDLTPAFIDAIQEIGKAHTDKFDNEGPGWTELGEFQQWKRQKAGIGAAHDILHFDGILEEGFVTLRDSNSISGSYSGTGISIEWNSIASSDESSFSTTIDGYKTIHQEGGGKSNIPARPFAIEEQQAADIINKHTEEWINQRLAEIWKQ